MNPTVKDEPAAIDAGFATGVRLIADIPEDKRVAVYMANPDLSTYGHGKYTGLMMERAGARNVANEIAGFEQVTMEDVLKWKPLRHLRTGALSGGGRRDQDDRILADDRRRQERPHLPDATICQGLGLSDVGSYGAWRTLDGEGTLSGAVRRYRHAEGGGRLYKEFYRTGYSAAQ